MPADDMTRLMHMLTYAEKTVAIARGRCRKDLETDTTLEFALLHGVQTIGGAAANVSEAMRANAVDSVVEDDRHAESTGSWLRFSGSWGSMADGV